MTGKRIGVWLAILAGLQAIAGATALGTLLPAPAAQWVQLIVGAFGAATAVYIGRAASLPADCSGDGTNRLDTASVTRMLGGK
jgi:hypothetical protein